jgi:hypothetical protein
LKKKRKKKKPVGSLVFIDGNAKVDQSVDTVKGGRGVDDQLPVSSDKFGEKFPQPVVLAYEQANRPADVLVPACS